MKKYGFHVKIPKQTGVLLDTPLTAMAFFLGSSQSWKLPIWNQNNISKFIKTLDECPNLSSNSIVVHGCYLMNPASTREDVVEKTKLKFVNELQLCDTLGVDNYVFHPGTTKDTQKGLCKTIDLINLGLSKTKKVNILVENMTKTNSLCQTWEELDFILRHVNNKRVGCCLDTAHCWGAGSQKRMFMDTLLNDFDRIINIQNLKAIHLNDSKVEYGSNKDRHEDILVGKIPKSFWKKFICDKRVEDIPTILETPTNCRDTVTKIINGQIIPEEYKSINIEENIKVKQSKISRFFTKQNKCGCNLNVSDIKVNNENKKTSNLNLDLLLPNEWKEILSVELNKDYFINLNKTLQKYCDENRVFYPPINKIFNAFNCIPSNIKVVILGQDPYHGKGQAQGLSFSVPENMKIPSSLKNIFKEIKSDIENFIIPKHGNLQKWVNQGVFLLNTTLTVFESKAGSHSKIGWSIFTDSVIKHINKNCKNIVFMLWGNHAKKKSKLIDFSRHLILSSAHPSGLSAHRGFFGCKHFSKCNKYLLENNKGIIKWEL